MTKTCPDCLAEAVKNYFAIWDRCGGEEAVAAEEFAQGRQAMRAALAATPAVGGEALAGKIKAHVETLANTGMNLSLIEWDAISNDLLSAAQALAQSSATPAVGGEAVAWRTKNEFGYWHVTRDRALAATWIKNEEFEVQPLYTAQPASPLRGPVEFLPAVAQTLRFFRSVIQSGDNWSPVCQARFDEAHAAVLALSAIPPDQPQYLTGCLNNSLNEDGRCQELGLCLMPECRNAGQVIVKRVCVEPKQDGIVYPGVET